MLPSRRGTDNSGEWGRVIREERSLYLNPEKGEGILQVQREGGHSKWWSHMSEKTKA